MIKPDEIFYTIEEAKIHDLSEILKIERMSFEYPWSEDTFLALFSVLFTKKFIIKNNEDKILGFLIYNEIFEEFHILNIAVHKEAQGKGIGTKLLNFIIEKARKQNDAYIFLEVRTTNISAINLYKKFNFEILETKKAYYENGDDAFIMLLKHSNFKGWVVF